MWADRTGRERGDEGEGYSTFGGQNQLSFVLLGWWVNEVTS